jgi:hypothetical protein
MCPRELSSEADLTRRAAGPIIYSQFFRDPYGCPRQTQTLTTRTHTHPYEYTYANPTHMSTSEVPSTDRSGDSRSHQWRLVIDGNVAYHLTHNTDKSWKIQKKVRAKDLNSGG